MKHILLITTLLTTKQVGFYIGWFVIQAGFELHQHVKNASNRMGDERGTCILRCFKAFKSIFDIFNVLDFATISLLLAFIV